MTGWSLKKECSDHGYAAFGAMKIVSNWKNECTYVFREFLAVADSSLLRCGK
jgi:hypothetical protein